jgi:purine-binding chemotaxis protein CheW
MAEDSGEEIQLVVFKLNNEEYGVEISQVREIIKMTKITNIPRAPPFLEGVINLRGQITAVMDLKKRLGLKGRAEGEKARIIIGEIGDIVMGMIVDSVSEVLRIEVKNIDPTPSISTEIEAEYIRGVGKVGDRLIILLDIEKILTPKEVAQVKEIQ